MTPLLCVRVSRRVGQAWNFSLSDIDSKVAIFWLAGIAYSLSFPGLYP